MCWIKGENDTTAPPQYLRASPADSKNRKYQLEKKKIREVKEEGREKRTQETRNQNGNVRGWGEKDARNEHQAIGGGENNGGCCLLSKGEENAMGKTNMYRVSGLGRRK